MIGRQDFFARARKKAPRYTTEQLYAAYETFLTCPISPFREERDTAGFDCGRCGNCCRRPWRVEATLHDVLRWIAEGRHDILASLDYRPRGPDDEPEDISPLVRQLASQLAGEDEDHISRALSVAKSVEACEGSYVLPKKNGCSYLAGGKTTACRIYDTRPEVCRRFPGVL
jgi:Fe-S-cluster containining protein